MGTLEKQLRWVHPEDRERYRKTLVDAHMAEEPFDVEYRIVRPDGELRYLREIGDPFFDAQGKFVRSNGVIQDVTPLREAEEALRESERRLKAIADHSPTVICLKDTDGRYTFVNRQFERLHGRPADEVLGKTAAELFPSEFATPFGEHDQAVLEEARDIEREQRVHCLDGERTFMEVKFPIFGPNNGTVGKPEAVGLIGTDMTDRKEAAEALIRAEKEYREIFEAAPVGIYRSSLDGRFVRINPALAKLFGYDSPEDMIASIEDIATQFYADPKLRTELAKMSQGGGQVPRLEAEALRKDGRKIWIGESFRSICNERGEALYFEGFIEDITQRKAAEEALRDSESLKGTILECALDCIVTIDEEGRLLEFNPAAEQTFDYSKQAVLGQRMVDLIVPPQLRDAHRAGFQRHLDTGETTVLGKRIELAAVGADGNEFPIEIAITTDQVEGRRVFTAFIRDITQRKEVEQALETARQEAAAAEALLADAVENMSEGIVVYDAEDRLLLCNSKFKEIYKYEDKDVMPGVTYEELGRIDIERGTVVVPPGEEHSYFSHRMDYRRRPEGTFEVQLRDGRWLQIRDRRTSAGGVVSLQADVTERKNAELELREAKEQAEAATEAKSRFLANMSHELRTPLNAVIGITEMLQEDAADQDLNDFLEPLKRIERAGKHLLRLINEVLDLSRIEAGRVEFQIETFDIATLLQDVASTAESLAQQNENRLTLVPTDGLGTMEADLTRVRQVMLNLVSNACKFTERGDIAIDAERQADGSGERILFTVTDSGIGIPEDLRPRLFEEFSQADSSTTRKYGGTGLGLAISRRLCRMMGGEISVETHVGKGSTFKVALPAKSAVAVAGPEPVTGPQETLGRRSGTGQNAVLVIDDDATARDLMQRYLAKSGLEVVTASDGEEGLELARRIRPSVITLDVLMPGLDGWSILRELKADETLAGIPVVMVTILDEAQKGYALGASEFMTKPVDRERLMHLIEKYRDPSGGCEILVVEDDPDVRSLLRRTLTKEGWHVREAENGKLGLEAVAENRPTAIILDLLMPEMDGFQFLAEFRKAEENRAVPVVVVTGADLDEAARRLLSGGVEHVLQKAAYSRNEMLAELKGLIARYIPEGPRS